MDHITIPFKCKLFNSNFRAMEFVEFERGDLLLFVDKAEMPFMSKDLNLAAARAVKNSYKEFTKNSYGIEKYAFHFNEDFFFDSINNTLSYKAKNDRKIEGFEFVNVDKMKRIWLSTYDFDLMKSFKVVTAYKHIFK